MKLEQSKKNEDLMESKYNKFININYILAISQIKKTNYILVEVITREIHKEQKVLVVFMVPILLNKIVKVMNFLWFIIIKIINQKMSLTQINQFV